MVIYALWRSGPVYGSGFVLACLAKLGIQVVVRISKWNREFTSLEESLPPIELKKLLPPIYFTVYSGACLGALLPLLEPQRRVLAGSTAALGALCWLHAGVTNPGEVPADDPAWSYYGDAVARESSAAICRERKQSGDRRHCKWCGCYKPDRAHHCRLCRKCVLKMDHHMLWINNCIGFRNYRFFVQGLCYQAFWRLSFFASSPAVASFIRDESQTARSRCGVFAASLSVAFDGLLLVFFCAFHFFLIKNRMTTIEFCEKNNESSYSFRIVPNPLAWFLPISPPRSEAGLSFP